MRVMHVIDTMGHGGAESLIVEHVRHAGPGVTSVICAINRGGASLDAAQALGASVHVLSGGSRAGRWGRLAALMRAERVDAVNAHNPTGAFYAAPAALAGGVRVVLRTEHSIHYPGRHSSFYPLIEAATTLLTRRVVCVCRAVLESHVSRLPWAARRFVTVANGVSSAPHTRPRGETRAALGLPPGARVALSVGSLTRQKAQHLLLEAFATAAAGVPEAWLLLAGDGPLRPRLEARIAELGLGDRVRLLGPRHDVADLVEACDLFVLSSVREGLPVTVLEAMRGGRAAIATRIGGCAEAVLDGVTGRIVPVEDVAALSAALAEALGEPARLQAWGEAGRRRWAEHFTAERMVRETEALYAEELARVRHHAAREGAPVAARAEGRSHAAP